MFKKHFLSLLAILLCGTAASATTMVYDSDGNSDGPGTVYLTDNAMRMGAGDGNWVLFDRSANTMFIVDDQAQEYFVIDDAQIQALGETLGNVNKQIEEALAALPPGQRAQARAMMESMMPGGGAPASSAPKDIVDVGFTGRSDKVAGIQCEIVETRINNELESELCIADSDDLNISRGEKATIAAMGDFAENMLNTMQEHAGSLFPSNFSSGSIIEVLDNGIPIRMIDKSNNDVSQLESISHDAISIELTSVPANYDRKPFGPGL